LFHLLDSKKVDDKGGKGNIVAAADIDLSSRTTYSIDPEIHQLQAKEKRERSTLVQHASTPQHAWANTRLHHPAWGVKVQVRAVGVMRTATWILGTSLSMWRSFQRVVMTKKNTYASMFPSLSVLFLLYPLSILFMLPSLRLILKKEQE
jgi:hypothetical protein